MWHMNVYDMTIYDRWTSAEKGTWRPFHSQRHLATSHCQNQIQRCPERYSVLGSDSGLQIWCICSISMWITGFRFDQICNPHDPILQVVLYILISHSLKTGLWSLINWLCQMIMGVVGGQTSTRLALGNGGSQPSVGFWGNMSNKFWTAIYV